MMIRRRSRKLIIISLLIVLSVIMWFILYWNMTSSLAQYKHHRFLSRVGAYDGDALSDTANEIGIYSEIMLDKLAKVVTADDQRKHDQGYQNHAFNQMVSDKLSYTRSLPDVRGESCRDKTYPTKDLPAASVVICFYNEAMSALLRTIHTVLARSPEHLIHEIILVDDFSDFEYLKTELQEYINRELPKVKLLRSEERLGLIRARMFGAKAATGQTLLFLDSHCEVNVGWLEPLLSVIHKNRQGVAVPIMDIVDADSFYYEPSNLVRGGFTWSMHFQWEPLPSDVSKQVHIDHEPFPTPTMAGGLFAMDRNYFHELGEYDSGMDIWGGENLELSFRIWQCGGRLVIVPCSRVGHIFRKRRPYGSPVQDSFTKNTLRMVHVWLDDYKRYYFHINPRGEDMEFGNVQSRIQLRKDLNCKSFQWYLENVYPEQLSKLPDLNKPLYPLNPADKGNVPAKVPIRSRGLLKNMASGLCVQSEKTPYDKRSLLQLAVCQKTNKDQLWYETEQKDFRLANLLCMDVNEDEAPFARLMKCKGSYYQQWIWDGKGSQQHLQNYGSSKCLVATGVDPGAPLKTMTCSDSQLMAFRFTQL